MNDRSRNGVDEWDLRIMIAIIGICTPSGESLMMMDIREGRSGME
jgi:hypothetical protein